MGVRACLGDLTLAATCCSLSSHLLHALSKSTAAGLGNSLNRGQSTVELQESRS
jgi:hypothetical protein